MAVKSLNEAYEKNAFIYLCNACGDINDPADPKRICTPEDIPSILRPKERVLFDKYWSEGSGALMYVLRIGEDTAAMALGFLFDSSWCQELAEKESGRKDIRDDELKSKWMPRLFLALSDAVSVSIQQVIPGFDIYVGNNTDPDGHEILVVVPYADRDKIEETVKKLNDLVYQVVEELF